MCVHPGRECLGGARVVDLLGNCWLFQRVVHGLAHAAGARDDVALLVEAAFAIPLGPRHLVQDIRIRQTAIQPTGVDQDIGMGLGELLDALGSDDHEDHDDFPGLSEILVEIDHVRSRTASRPHGVRDDEDLVIHRARGLEGQPLRSGDLVLVVGRARHDDVVAVEILGIDDRTQVAVGGQRRFITGPNHVDAGRLDGGVDHLGGQHGVHPSLELRRHGGEVFRDEVAGHLAKDFLHQKTGLDAVGLRHRRLRHQSVQDRIVEDDHVFGVFVVEIFHACTLYRPRRRRSGLVAKLPARFKIQKRFSIAQTIFMNNSCKRARKNHRHGGFMKY